MQGVYAPEKDTTMHPKLYMYRGYSGGGGGLLPSIHFFWPG